MSILEYQMINEKAINRSPPVQSCSYPRCSLTPSSRNSGRQTHCARARKARTYRQWGEYMELPWQRTNVAFNSERICSEISSWRASFLCTCEVFYQIPHWECLHQYENGIVLEINSIANPVEPNWCLDGADTAEQHDWENHNRPSDRQNPIIDQQRRNK